MSGKSVSIQQIESDIKTLLFTGEIFDAEDRAARLKAIDDAVEIMEDLTSELHHQVHAPGCRCEYGIRKLRSAMAHLRAIHWAGMPAGKCDRRDSGVDSRTVKYLVEGGEGAVTNTSIASYYGNITCPVCRKFAWAAGVR